MNFIGVEAWPPGAAGEGMVPPCPPPSAEADGMRIFEDNIIWYQLPLQLEHITEKEVAAGRGGKW
jgi:hypothetical protein